MALPPESPRSDVPASLPAAYPTRWEFDAVLTDGGIVHVRPVRPSDAVAVDAFHTRQSRETIYFRYFSPLPRLSARYLERIVSVDYVTRMAFVALLGDDIVGMASYDIWGDRNEAEVAFITDDEHQGRGLATVLLEYLAVAARENGLDGLTATVLPTNRKMIGVFRDAGFQVASMFDEGVIEVRLGIEPTDQARRQIEHRERRSEAASVARLLSPSSIAVIGAGRERGGIGHEVFRNLVAGGFEGPVYPVNPAGGHVASVRAFPSVLDIPDAVDLAVVAVPASGVLDVVEECGRKRVGGLVIFSAGFDQLPDGTEEHIVERAHATGMRVIGPESMGVINTAPGVSLVANFAEVTVAAGGVGFLTQSGTLGLAALDHAHRLGVGFSTFVDVGSKLDVSGNDLLQYWADDDRTSVIALHLQSFGNPLKFTRIARALARVKPIVAVKTGLGPPAASARRLGETAAPRWEGPDASWPGRDADADAVIGAMLAQSGVIRVDTPTELFDAARVLSTQPVPAGRRVAVVSNARGASVVAMDACRGAGLVTPEPSAATVEALAGAVPSGARLSNPLELTWEAGPEAYAAAVATMLADPAFDSVIVVYAAPVQPRPEAVARAVGDALAGASPEGVTTADATQGKPVLATFLGFEPGVAIGGYQPPMPLFQFPGEGAQTLGRLAAYGEWLSRPPGRLAPPDALGLDLDAVSDRVEQILAAAPEGRVLDHPEAADLLLAAGLPACPTTIVDGPDEAAAAASAMGYPVVLKASGLDRYHRGEVGGIALDLHDEGTLRAAFARMEATWGAAMRPAVVQKAAPPGVDVLVAGRQHPAVGAVVSVGLGGALAAIDEDRPARVVPLSDTDAAELVAASPVGELLGGEATGSATTAPVPLGTAALELLLERVSALLEHVPEVATLSANPVIAGRAAATFTDVSIRVAPHRPPTAPDVRRLD